MKGSFLGHNTLCPLKLVHLGEIFLMKDVIFWHQCWNQGTIGGEKQWIRSQGGAGGRTGRSGGAEGRRWMVRSTASGTCIVAETVQESLWNNLMRFLLLLVLLLHPLLSSKVISFTSIRGMSSHCEICCFSF